MGIRVRDLGSATGLTGANVIPIDRSDYTYVQQATLDDIKTYVGSGTGTSGTSGAGTSGKSGTSGTSATGTSGTSGTSSNGTSGTSGKDGSFLGSSGTSGVGSAGTSGTGGISGSSGQSPTYETDQLLYYDTGTTTLYTPHLNISALGTSGDNNTKLININGLVYTVTGVTGGGSGTSGTSGSGSPGSSGTSGDSGTSGTSASGTSGTSASGTSGSSGKDGGGSATSTPNTLAYFDSGGSLTGDTEITVSGTEYTYPNIGNQYGIYKFDVKRINVLIGVAAPQSTTGTENVFIGRYIADGGDHNHAANIGSYNVGIGGAIFSDGAGGSYNNAIGQGAQTTGTGQYNNAYGQYALHAVTGNYNNGIGFWAGTSPNLSGSLNNLFGYYAGYTNSTFSYSNNLFLGNYAGLEVLSGDTLVIDSINRTTWNNQWYNGLITGYFNATSSNQKLNFNAQVNVKHNLSVGGNQGITGNLDVTGKTTSDYFQPLTNYKSADSSDGVTHTFEFTGKMDGTSGTVTATVKNGILVGITRV